MSTPKPRKCPKCKTATPTAESGGFGGSAIVKLCGVCGHEYQA